MFKRFIIGLFTISLVAMFWASAGAQAVYGPYGCQTTDYIDPTTGIGWYICDYYVWFDGKWVLSKQWYYWAGGSGIQGIRFKVSNDAKDCPIEYTDPEGHTQTNVTRCSITASVMFGTVKSDGSDDYYRYLDYNSLIYGVEYLVNPKCYRKNPPPECGDPPGNTSGNPGVSPGSIPINYDFFDDCVKNGMCQDTVYLPFDVSDCPNVRWDCTFIPERFLGLTCNAMYGLGWYTIPGTDPAERILVPCGSRERTDGLDPGGWYGGFGTCKEIQIADKKGNPIGDPLPFIEATVTLGYCENTDLLPDDDGNITYQFGDPVGYDCNYNSPEPAGDDPVPSDIYCSAPLHPTGVNETGCYASAPDPDGNGPLTFCSDLFNRGFNPGYQSPLGQ